MVRPFIDRYILNLSLGTLFLLFWQEEEELLKEMELTGQAYEEKQEQNIRLVQQLKEKDDANFKLMSEVCQIVAHLLVKF